MTKLYEIREVLITLYKRYEKWVLPVLKFIFALMVFSKLNGFLNYAKVLNKPIIDVGLAAMASFIPGNWIILLLIVVISSHLAYVSIEAVAIIFIIMLVIYLLYLRLVPKMAYLVIATPLLFSLGIPYVLPVFAGLFIGPLAIIPIGIGIVIYFFGGYIPSIVAIKSTDLTNIPDSLMSMYKTIMDSLLDDKAMLLTIIIFIAVILITYFISRLEFDYIWYFAIIAGGVTNMLGFTVGNIILKTDISLVGVVLGSILAIAVVAACQFMKVSVDYSRAEKVQFEDDDYIYYVRAIPKIKIAKQIKKIKRINSIPK
ncbi:hypothetical protein HZI73_04380 [Vallitalea pronyensis]|uniref:Uncharacterized protein n=1 Tax=Vallitalea pronyensis TaxID=1348613 RepID=A0A8J8MH99_9FIRM|nr:hypothetical protein [Vallitalea pronyensis]QUI21574.1 hypothetical protein HZI73_04380 [Vallitalea pronyensis]